MLKESEVVKKLRQRKLKKRKSLKWNVWAVTSQSFYIQTFILSYTEIWMEVNRILVGKWWSDAISASISSWKLHGSADLWGENDFHFLLKSFFSHETRKHAHSYFISSALDFSMLVHFWESRKFVEAIWCTYTIPHSNSNRLETPHSRLASKWP